MLLKGLLKIIACIGFLPTIVILLILDYIKYVGGEKSQEKFLTYKYLNYLFED